MVLVGAQAKEREALSGMVNIVPGNSVDRGVQVRRGRAFLWCVCIGFFVLVACLCLCWGGKGLQCVFVCYALADVGV